MTTHSHVLGVDRIACAGHGVCADLFPDWIGLDDWGFPIIDQRPIPAARLAEARWAAANCPALALGLEANHGKKSRGPRSTVSAVGTVAPLGNVEGT